MRLFRHRTDTPAMEMSVRDLKNAVEGSAPPLVVDVRQPDGYTSHPFAIPGSLRMPPADLPDRFGELPKDRRIVLYCT